MEKNWNIWVWNSEVWHNIPCFARYSGQSRWKCSTELHVLHPPPEIYQNISYRNQSFTLKQHQTRDTCNNETGHSCCHLRHAASLIIYASWNALLPMKEMSHMTLHLIAIWHLKRTIQHGIQLLSAQIHTQKGLDDVNFPKGDALYWEQHATMSSGSVFVLNAQLSHARSKLQLIM